jgi:SNF2 family DNA or RNA helicase
LDCQPRIDKILECLASSPRKTVIFVPFTGAMKAYHKAISKHYTSAMVYGDTSKKDRDKIFGAFQSSDEPHVLVCHPATTAHGLEFSIADKIIWAGPSQRGIHFLQANERIASALQKHPMTIYYIGSTPLEWKRFDSLIAKRDDQSALLDLYQMVVNHKA